MEDDVYTFSPTYRVWYITKVISDGLKSGLTTKHSVPCQTFAECEAFRRDLVAEPRYTVGALTKEILTDHIWYEDPCGNRVEKKVKRKKSPLTYDEVKVRIAYDDETKTLLWIDGKNKGESAVIMDRNGNPFVRFNSVERSAYRISWLLHNGSLPENRIRCASDDRSDMSIDNLKEEIKKEK